MGKICGEKACRAILTTVMVLAIILGIIFFLSGLEVDRYNFERLVIYSVLIIFGITMSVETYLYKRLQEEKAKLEKELSTLKKDLKQMKK